MSRNGMADKRTGLGCMGECFVRETGKMYKVQTDSPNLHFRTPSRADRILRHR